MLSVKLITVMTILSISIVSPVLSTDGSTFKCQGEIKDGKLELVYTKKSVSNNNVTTGMVAENCRILKFEFNTEEHVDWDKIEKFPMPKLILLALRFANPSWSIESKFIRDLDWKSLSVFGHEPEEVARLQYSIWAYLPVHGSISKTFIEMFEFSPGLTTLKISGLDPNPFLNKFKNQNIIIRTLIIKNNKFNNNMPGFKIPDGLFELGIQNVQIQNLSGLIQKLESVEFLSLDLNSSEIIDVGDILRVSKNLTNFDVRNSNLGFSDATVQSKSLMVLEVFDCTLDSSFRKNAWSAMPNLEELTLKLNSTFDIGDLSLNKNLMKLEIRNTKVTFTKPHEKFNELRSLNCQECEFDMTFGLEAKNAFPNLRRVSGFPDGWKME